MTTDGASVVVTGMSVWTCFGRGEAPLLAALKGGDRGARRVEGVPVDDPWFLSREAMQIAPEGRVASALGGVREVEPHAWPATLGVETALDAAVAAGCPHGQVAPRRVAVVSGTSHGSNHGLLDYLARELAGEAPDPGLLADVSSLVAFEIAARLGACGPAITLNTACSAGLNAIGQGWHMLREGRVDCVVAGGHDTFSYLSFAGFNSLRALDPRGCRPFDRERAGLSLADGAGYVVLEREVDARRRGATILARVTGYGCQGEGYHPTAPDPEGNGVYRAMRRALADDPAPSELALVSAHGTGTPANDSAEARAIGRVAVELGARGVRVVSLKSQVGHSLGAAGAVQTVAAILCMRERLGPANVGLVTPVEHGPELEFPAAPGPADLPLVLCNALGFAGSVASLALRLP